LAKVKVKVENKTGIAALDAIINASSKHFEKDLSGANYGDFEPFTTGSLQLDLALYIGGLPSGRVIEVIGQESSNKTSFCLSVVGLKQQARLAAGVTDKRDLILDLEHTLTAKFIKGFGIDLDQCIWIQPESAEEALQISMDYVKSGAIDNVIVDSVDAMQNVKQQQRSVGETDVGGISKEMSFALRQISKLAPKHGTTYFFINQIRMNPGVMFGSPETTPGGKSLAFYSTIRLKCMRREPCPALPNATTMRVKIIKSKCGPDYPEVIKMPFVHGVGFAQSLAIMNVAKDFELLRNSAGQTKVRWDPEDDEAWEPLLPDVERGKAAGEAALADNPWLLEKLRQLCLHVGGVTTAMPLEEIQALGPVDAE
jgi:recombination protein RecA